MLEFFWGTSTRKWITSTCAAIAGMMTVITTTNAAWPTIEYWTYAHRGYVRWYVGDIEKEEVVRYKTAQAEMQRTLRHIQIEQAEGKREAAENDLYKWKLELGRAGDQQTKDLINERVRQLDATRGKLDKQINTLQSQP